MVHPYAGWKNCTIGRIQFRLRRLGSLSRNKNKHCMVGAGWAALPININHLKIYIYRWFKGLHTHGTIMPRLSSIANPNSTSHGFTFTVPEKSFVKGNEIKILRRSYNRLRVLWNGSWSPTPLQWRRALSRANVPGTLLSIGLNVKCTVQLKEFNFCMLFHCFITPEWLSACTNGGKCTDEFYLRFHFQISNFGLLMLLI